VQIDPEVRKQRTRTVFNAAAERFDDPVLSFWDLVGSRSVQLAGIRTGDRVLDVCCGTGSSALPAAVAAGAAGSVLGVDLAERLVELATAKAKARGLANAAFRAGDMTALDVADGAFDAVVCVFGVFFVEDMQAAMREMWRALRPGGVLAITTWGRQVFEPAGDVYWDAVGNERPDLRQPTPPWARIVDPPGLRRLYADAGLPEPDVVVESFTNDIEPDDFWTIVLGSGYRGPIDAMGPEAAARVRENVLGRLRTDAVRRLSSEVMYSQAHKHDGAT
jgi:ubiquinone/menaquinone biosynthesis C-methylase UbiE